MFNFVYIIPYCKNFRSKNTITNYVLLNINGIGLVFLVPQTIFTSSTLNDSLEKLYRLQIQKTGITIHYKYRVCRKTGFCLQKNLFFLFLFTKAAGRLTISDMDAL